MKIEVSEDNLKMRSNQLIVNGVGAVCDFSVSLYRQTDIEAWAQEISEDMKMGENYRLLSLNISP